MNRFFQIALSCSLLLSLAGVLAVSRPLRAQEAQAPAASAASSGANDANAAGQEDETAPYRHSATVRAIAQSLHLDTETVAKSFEFLNFAILAVAVLYGFFKYLPQTLRRRREDLQKRLTDARAATGEANERLRLVEEKFARLDEEIAAIRSQAEREGVSEEARMKALIEAERERIVAAAEQEIAAAALAARRDLKRFAGELAIERAHRMIAVNPERDRILVSQFTRELGDEVRNGGRN